MLGELVREVLEFRVFGGELEGDFEHVLAVEGHPRRAVGLLEMPSGRQRRAAVEDADVVEAQESSREDVASRGVLAVEPPVEVEEQHLEAAAQEIEVATPVLAAVHAVDEQGRPGVHRRVDVAEVPLVGGDLAARVQVHLAQHQLELLLGELDVHHRQRERVERKVPRRVPGIFPLVRHRDDVAVEHVEPVDVARTAAESPAHRVRVVLRQPAIEVEVVVLLRPEHSGQRLADHPVLVLAEHVRRDAVVELVGLAQPVGEDTVELRTGCRCEPWREPELHRALAVRGDLEHVVRRGLRAAACRADRVTPAGDHVVVEGVLHAGRLVLAAKQTLVVALVLGEEQRRVAIADEFEPAELGVARDDHSVAGGGEQRALGVLLP